MIKQDQAAAESAHGLGIVAHHNNGLPFVSKVLQARLAFGLKFGVADGKDFVDQQNIGVDFDGNGKCQAHKHARRVLLYR